MLNRFKETREDKCNELLIWRGDMKIEKVGRESSEYRGREMRPGRGGRGYRERREMREEKGSQKREEIKGLSSNETSVFSSLSFQIAKIGEMVSRRTHRDVRDFSYGCGGTSWSPGSADFASSSEIGAMGAE
jgi:hypothetical protein